MIVKQTNRDYLNSAGRAARTFADALWAGRTRVPKGLQWEFYDQMFQADWAVPAYDPNEAKKLLREAGYKGNPIPFRVLNNYYTGQVATAQVVTEMWKQVGVNVEDDATGVLPLGHLLADHLGREHAAVNVQRPNPDIRLRLPRLRVGKDGQLLAQGTQPRRQPFARRP